MSQLERLSAAERMLAEARADLELGQTIEAAMRARDVADYAEAARVFAREANLGTLSVNHATVIKMKAERCVADAVDKGQEARQITTRRDNARPDACPPSGQASPQPAPVPIDEIIDKRRLHEARKIRDNYTDDDLIELEQQANDADEVLSRKELVTKPRGKLISQSGGSEHWYTPEPHIEAARGVLGAIDLDPASSDIANRTVRASRYYTVDDDGLAQDWQGRLWMNPPYGEPAGRFVAKLAGHLDDGSVTAAVVLVSLNAMSAQWFGPLFDGLLCVTNGRLKFTDQEGNAGSPTFGSVFAYFGPEQDLFAKEFRQFGNVLARWQ